MSGRSKAPLAVGIDLGTTFSAVAYLDETGRPRTIQNAEGGLTTPSAVFFDRSGVLVGAEAIEAGLLEPERLALLAKRDVGEVAFRKQILGHSFPPEVLQALILKKLKDDAELVIGPFEKAVVTVPAFFNEPCRKATQDAGRLAGLDVIDIINEPTAAAITYGVQHGFLSAQNESHARERLLVYDLGGGTFDVTIMELDGRKFNTVSTAGDVYLGGVDWDRRIADCIAEAFIKEHGVDPRENAFGAQELMQKATQVKHALTQRESFIIGYNFEGMRLRTELSQSEFAKLTEDLVERTLLTTRIALEEAKLDFKQLTRLLLVGGSTRMPMIHTELQRLSGLTPDRSLSPDEAICQGAAIYAGVKLNQCGDSFAGVSVTNVNSHDLGVLAIDPRTGQPKRQVMIARNSPLPASKLVRFRTHQTDQPNVKIQVVEGGDDVGTNATMVGKCYVDPLPLSTPKGTHVDVRFDYAQDGRLTVSASLPELNCQAITTLDRGQRLSADRLENWAELIAAGFGDLQPVEQSPAVLGTPKRKKLKRLEQKDSSEIATYVSNAPAIKIGGDNQADSVPEPAPVINIDTGDWKSRRKRIR